MPPPGRPRRAAPAHHSASGPSCVAPQVGARPAAAVLLLWPLFHLGLPATAGLFLLDGLTFLLAAILILPLPHLGGDILTIRVSAALHTSLAIAGARGHLRLAALASFCIGLAFRTCIVLAYGLVGPPVGVLA